MQPLVSAARLLAVSLVFAIAPCHAQGAHGVLAIGPQPVDLAVEQGGTLRTQVLVFNPGSTPLRWSVRQAGTAIAPMIERDAEPGSLPDATPGWNSTRWLVAAHGNGQGMFVADDFTVLGGGPVQSLRAEGQFLAKPGMVLMQRWVETTFVIFADAQGKPAGMPLPAASDFDPIAGGFRGEVYRCARGYTQPRSGVSITDLPYGAGVELLTEFAASDGCPPPPVLEQGRTYWLLVYVGVPGNIFSTRDGMPVREAWQWSVSANIGVLEQGTGHAPRAIRTDKSTFAYGFAPYTADAQAQPRLVAYARDDWRALPALNEGLSAMAFTVRLRVPCGAPWLRVVTDGGGVIAGQIAPSQAQAIELEADAVNLSQGTYHANLCVSSDDPDRTQHAVPVVLTVR
jgi:hypothetical protein